VVEDDGIAPGNDHCQLVGVLVLKSVKWNLGMPVKYIGRECDPYEIMSNI